MKRVTLITLVLILFTYSTQSQWIGNSTIGINDLQNRTWHSINARVDFTNFMHEGDSNYTISIQKNIFKKYEPIYVQLNYTNTSNNVDSIFTLFDSYSDETEIYITDEKNNIYKKLSLPEIHFIYDKPKYILQSGESLTVSRSINDYGTSCVAKERYFGQFGYFTPGKYKIYIEGNTKYQKLKSNVLEFEVIDANNEDIEILNLVKDENFKSIIGNEKFIANSLMEHVFAYRAITCFPVNDVYNTYTDFLDKYPNSLYNTNDLFVRAFFQKLIYNNPNLKINSEYEKIANKYKETLFGSFLRKKFYEKSITENLNNIKGSK